MPDQLNIGVNVDVGQLNAGMDAAASSVAEASAKMTASFQSAAEAAQALATTQTELKGILDAAGGSINENNALWGLYTETTARAAAAQEFLTATTAETTEATNAAASATNRYGGMQAYVAGRSAAMVAGLNQEGFMFGMLARALPGIENAMGVIFPVAIAGMFAMAIAQIAQNVKKWYDNTVLLQGAIQDMTTSEETSADAAAQRNWQAIQSAAALQRTLGHTKQAYDILRDHINEQPLKISLGKIKDSDLQQVESLVGGISKLYGELKAVGTLGSGQALAAPTKAAISAGEAQLQKLHAQLAEEQRQLATPLGPDLSGAMAGQHAQLQTAITETQARIQLVTQTVQTLKNSLDQVTSAGTTAANTLDNDLAKPAKHKKDELAGWGTMRTRVQAEIFAKSQEAVRQADEKATRAEEHLTKITNAHADAQARLNNLIADYVRSPENKRTQTDNLLAILGPGFGAEKPGKAPIDAKAVAKEADKAFAGVNRGMDQMVQGVMMGTQTMAQAWRRMWADMVISETEHLAQSLIKYIEHQAMMLAVTASGISSKQAIADAGNAHAKLSDAKAGAVHTWKSVLKALPFPLNIMVAPVAAGAEFAAMMAFERGGVVPTTGPALVHQHEMVLPAHIARHVMETAGGGGGGGSRNINVTTNVHALDGADAHYVLSRHSSSIAQGVQREMRRRGLV